MEFGVGYQHFGGICHLTVLTTEQQVPLRYPLIKLHGTAPRKPWSRYFINYNELIMRFNWPIISYSTETLLQFVWTPSKALLQFGLKRDVESTEIMEGGDEPWWLILMLVIYTYTKCNGNHLLFFLYKCFKRLKYFITLLSTSTKIMDFILK